MLTISELTSELDPVDNLLYDLITTKWIIEKISESKVYAQNLFATICFRQFQKAELIHCLKDITWSCSISEGNAIISSIYGYHRITSWFLSELYETHNESSIFDSEDVIEAASFVRCGVVTDEIREDLEKLGWIVLQRHCNYE